MQVESKSSFTEIQAIITLTITHSLQHCSEEAYGQNTKVHNGEQCVKELLNN